MKKQITDSIIEYSLDEDPEEILEDQPGEAYLFQTEDAYFLISLTKNS